MQSANIRAGASAIPVIAANLQARLNTALATLDGARRIAANTPVEVSSAPGGRPTGHGAVSGGTGDIDDVAEAQRLLVQAEIDDALARLSVWRATAWYRDSRGDIQPFVAEASQ